MIICFHYTLCVLSDWCKMSEKTALEVLPSAANPASALGSLHLEKDHYRMYKINCECGRCSKMIGSFTT